MSDIDDIKALLAGANEKVKSNAKVITPESIGQDYLIHISMDTNIKKFVPFISPRQSPKEDRTMPRVCVSSSLLGAMCGYAGMESDFLNFITGDKATTGPTYRGGMKIYTIPFTTALEPGRKLVYDQHHSDEYWLVTYNKETVEYKPEPAGKMFFHSITFVSRDGKPPVSDGMLYVEVTKEDGLAFTPDIFLEKGYYIIEGPTPQFTTLTYSDKTHKKNYTIKSIDRAEFLSVKNANAALLGYEVPTYMGW